MELPRSKPPVFSRVVTGPIESVNDYDHVEITSELLLPIITSQDVRHGFPVYITEVQQLAYRQSVSGRQWKSEAARDHVEKKVRLEMAHAIVDRYSIPLRAELHRFNPYLPLEHYR